MASPSQSGLRRSALPSSGRLRRCGGSGCGGEAAGFFPGYPNRARALFCELMRRAAARRAAAADLAPWL